MYSDHDHGGEYADLRHGHHGDYAEERHRHDDLENADEKAQRCITALQDEVDGLRGQLADALERIAALEMQAPQARQLQLEADQAAADLAASGYDRHGRDCGCSYCCYDPEEDETERAGQDPGPETGSESGEPQDICPETSDGYHCTHRQEGVSRCCACGSEPDEDQAGEPEPQEFGPGPEIDDEGGMSEYRYILPEDYQRGQS